VSESVCAASIYRDQDLFSDVESLKSGRAS